MVSIESAKVQIAPQRLSVKLTLPLVQFTLNVSFDASHNSTGIFGVSGSGKTSLLEACAGLRPKSRGEIKLGKTPWLSEQNQLNVSPQKRGIGYVPQDALLYPNLTAQANISVGKPRALKANWDWEYVFNSVTDALHLQELLSANVLNLSGGERQRVALARALCSAPSLLLLDEPMASLDVGLRHEVRRFLLHFVEEHTIPMLIVSHQPIDILVLCQDVLVIDRGSIKMRGEPADVLTRPEVYPLAESEGFANVLHGTIVKHHDHTSVLQLDGNSEAFVTIPRSTANVGEQQLISIAADSIILATQHPTGLSARNSLPSKIERIDSGPRGCLVHARINDACTVVVEITNEAVEELSLSYGLVVYLVIKSRSFILV